MDVDGADVYKRPDDHTKDGVTNPDAIVRYDDADPGRFTEFKELQRPTSAAVKNDIIRAGDQLSQYGGGDAVIDGRNVQLDEAEARRGYARAVGQARQHKQALPRRVRMILPGGRMIDLDEGGA